MKKSELYSMLWEACNKLRGGVEPSRYKDYVLVLLFFKYVSDRYKGQPFAEFTISKGASFEDLIEAKTGINTMTAEDPMTAVAIGTGKYVEFLAGYRDEA